VLENVKELHEHIKKTLHETAFEALIIVDVEKKVRMFGGMKKL
jgi:hypothetical protein